ncbi:MAG: response regulator [Candidatus Sulfotelmatobacter sp.]
MARKILLADDSVTAQNMGRKILADAGYDVITVNNGSAALKKIGELRPDLVVLDVYMPGYSGLEVCQRLKENAETSRIPILLTVGKLEPFKPEEAKRVRADGFIVKPFEASELLSALSKLEDKIVPRAETSKPGRLARATAALDEVPRDKKVSGEEDSGWKNRISFPAKKKEKSEAEADDSAIYNPVNKDLRTVIAPRPAVGATQEETKVDLKALAPEGLPKDVTPEEIAALAAAAAQMQGTSLESKAEVAAAPSEAKIEANRETTDTEKKIGEARNEIPELAKEPQSAEPVAGHVTAVAGVEQPTSEKIEASQSQDAPTQAAPEAGNAPVEAIASVAESKEESEKAKNAGSEKESGEADHADLPVTMAVATGSESGKSRWNAVAVALAPEEAGVSLEQEMQQQMQKAYAPVAPEQTGTAEPSPVVESNAPVAPLEAATPMPDAPASEPPVPAAAEAAQTLTEIAAVATDTVRAAVREFETVAGAYVPQSEWVQPHSSSSSASSEASVSEPAPAVEKEVAPSPVTAEETNKIEAEERQPAPENIEPQKAEILVSASEVPASEVAAAPEVEAPVAQATVEHDSSAQSSSSHPAHPANGTRDHEGDNLSATTAAAWASWRRIRGSDTPEDAHDSAAMAAAAGAEKSPEAAMEVNESDPAIASIVDSVLADLRPRIVEEISRKLGKKK